MLCNSTSKHKNCGGAQQFELIVCEPQ